VDVRSGFDFFAKILVAEVAVFWFGSAAEQEGIVRLVRLVTYGAVGFSEDRVRIAFPGYSVAPCARLLDRTAFQQELGVGGVGLVTTCAAAF